MSKKSEKSKRYKQRHPEKVAEMRSRYYEKHGDRLRKKGRERYREDAERRKELARAWAKKRHGENSIIIAQYKSTGCVVCGENDQRCLDLHHRNPEDKEYIASQMKQLSPDRLRTELAKCDVLCANCHRKIHDGNKDSTRLSSNCHNGGRPRIQDTPTPNA